MMQLSVSNIFVVISISKLDEMGHIDYVMGVSISTVVFMLNSTTYHS